jgi:type II secretory pathway pseudopilin PulG
MDTWLIVVIVVVVLAIAAVVLMPMLRRRGEEQRVQRAREAEEHLRESKIRSTQADLERATAAEQAAAAQRERAEAEQRALLAEREAQERLESARSEEARAHSLHQQAERLSPGVSDRSDGYAGSGEDSAVRSTETGASTLAGDERTYQRRSTSTDPDGTAGRSEAPPRA